MSKTMDITLDDLVQELGSYKKRGQHYYFQCKYCRDKHKDNMIYTPSKNLLKCFADSSHSRQLLSEIMKKKHEREKMNRPIERPRYLDLQEQYLYYMELCNMMLLGKLNERWLQGMVNQEMYSLDEYKELIQIVQSDKPQKAREYLKQKRGINTSTIELTGLGFDFIDKKWVIPIFDMSANLVGFRYRGANFDKKTVWTEKGTPKTLARFYGADTAKTCYCVEGEWDSLIMVQWLLENNQKDFMVVSPSNGASSLLSVIPQLQFNKFDKIKLIMDNDTSGDKATEEVISSYPFITDERSFLKQSGIKDINDFYLAKVLKVRKQ